MNDLIKDVYSPPEQNPSRICKYCLRWLNMYLFWCNTCGCKFETIYYWCEIINCDRCGSDDTELAI